MEKTIYEITATTKTRQSKKEGGRSATEKAGTFKNMEPLATKQYYTTESRDTDIEIESDASSDLADRREEHRRSRHQPPEMTDSRKTTKSTNMSNLSTSAARKSANIVTSPIEILRGNVKINKCRNENNPDDFIEPLGQIVTRKDVKNAKTENEASNEMEFRVVQNRRRPKKHKMGTSEDVVEDEGVHGFQARNYKKPEDRKLWLFISRTKSTVDENIVRDYIARKGNEKPGNISVKLLQTRTKAKDNNCFLVGVPLNMRETIYMQEFWPRGIQFQRFNFKLGQHFLNPNTEVPLNTQRTMTN